MDENKFVETTVEEIATENVSGGSFVGLVLGLAGGVVGLTAVALHLTKEKREQRAIDKLQKKGYVVYRPEVSGEESYYETEVEEKDEE